MTNLKSFFNNRFNTLFTVSSIIVFCYLLFRSINSSLVCDELTTFFRFIQPRFFLGDGSDANNHILNSYLSYIPYRIFGFSSLSIRLFSLLSVVIYFIYTYRFSKEIKSNIQRILFAFVMLFSLNFLQFFGLSRGYGYSFAFLLGALYHFYVFAKDNSKLNVKNLFYFSIFIALCLLANLATLLTTLTLSFFILVLVIEKRKLFPLLNWKQKSALITTSIFYLLVLLSMINYSFILKEKGALYYGNLQSFWYNVVLTQLDLLIQNKAFLMQGLLVIFFLNVTLLGLLSHKNFKFKELYKSNILFFVLILNLLGIELLALLFKVNYPSDRVAIHLYMMLVLALFFIDVSKNNLLRILKLITIAMICFIPIHNILTANYKNNTVWPLDYFPKRYYTKIVESKTHSDYYPTVSGNIFRGLNYGKYVYENNGKGNLIVAWKEQDSTLLDKNNHPGKYSDFIISKKENILSINYLYEKIDSNNVNEVCLWERRSKPNYKEINNVIFNSPNHTNNEFIDCGSLIIDSLNNQYLLIDLEFELDALELPFNGSLIVNSNDETTGKSLIYESYPIRYLKSFKSDKKFKQRIVLKKLHPYHNMKISTYIWNLKKEKVSISDGKVTFYKFIK